jgi:uncharacterized protein (DUF302 family)
LKVALSRGEVVESKSSSIAKYETSYGYHRVLDIPLNTAVQRVKEALVAEGFGVLREEEPDLGSLLPCNVVVYERESRVVVSAIDADKML